MLPKKNNLSIEIERYIKDMSFIIKKTHKIGVAAMVLSKCLLDNDPYKNELRKLSVELLKSSANFHKKGALEKEIIFGGVEDNLSTLNQVALALWSAGDISDQSFTVVKKAIHGLQDDLKNNNVPYGESVYTLDGAGFTGRKLIDDAWLNSPEETRAQKTGVSPKKDVFNVKDNPVSSSTFYVSESTPKRHGVGQKMDRINKIISFIKDKKDVSVKDISSVVEGVADKTIQRDLQYLIDKGHIKKTGKRRWARYVYLR
jgi:hypothetical protein